MMRYSLLMVIFICLACSAPLYALKLPDGKDAAIAPEKPAEQPGPPVTQSPRQPQKPADNFKPTEKIGADSAVSFPVDI